MSDSNSIKYRVAGATVIIISLMIAWFLLLQFDENRTQQVSKINIPKPVTVETFNVPVDTMPVDTMPVDTMPVDTVAADKDLIAPEPATETKLTEPVVSKPVVSEPVNQPVQKNAPIAIKQAPIKEKAKPAPVTTTYTRLNDENLPEAWVLQVASFKNKANAQKLQKTLLQDKYPAYIKSFTLDNGTIYRVLIGPKLSKARAKLLSDTIVSKYKLKSLIVQFKPGFSE